MALVGSAFAGMLVAVQSRVNGGLSQQLQNGFVAAALSFGVGLVVIAVVCFLTPRGRRGLGRAGGLIRRGKLPWWTLFGGLFGGMFVLSQGLVAAVIGLATFTVGIVAGQVSGGLIMDRIGLGPGGRVPLTVPRVLGTMLAVVAVVVTVSGEWGATGNEWMVVFPVLAGVGIALQSALNGLLRSGAESAVTATFMNFVMGFTMLALVAAVSVAVNGWPVVWPTNPVYYIGGAVGVVFIALATMLVRIAGVLLLSMSNIAGQLIAAVLIDLGMPLAGGVTWGMVVGAGIGLTALVVAAIPRRSTGS